MNARWLMALSAGWMLTAGTLGRAEGDKKLLQGRWEVVAVFDNHGKSGRNVLFVDGTGHWLAGASVSDAYKPIQTFQANYRTRTVD